MPYSEVLGVEGEAGDFRVSILRKPRFVDPKKCTLCDACTKVCPVEVEREFGGGLEKRKAIYLPFAQAIPHSLVIDPKTCIRCGECVRVCGPGAIDLDMKEERETIEVGAILLGFGFEPFWAQKKGEYGFGRYENVLTSIQFETNAFHVEPHPGISGSDVRSEADEEDRLYPVRGIPRSLVRSGSLLHHLLHVCDQAGDDRKGPELPALGVTFYYMDIRPMGKDYERYYERAKAEYGIDI